MPRRKNTRSRSRRRHSTRSHQRKIRGRGKYSITKFAKSFGRGVSSTVKGGVKGLTRRRKTIGKSLKSLAPLAGYAHPLAGHIVRATGDIMGHGSYHVKRNTLLDPNQIPSFAKNRHEIRVRNREYLFDLTGTTSSFAASYFNINPGDNQCFPWLSATLGAACDEYQFHGLVFEFKPTSGTSVGTTNETLGWVAMATQYNSTQPAFTSKQQMLEYEFSTSSSPIQSQIHAVECAKSETVLNNLYTRNSLVPYGQDSRLYDLGTLYVACGGQQSASTVLGEVWVSYDVSLYKNKYPNTPPSAFMYGYATSGITNANILGTNFVQTGSFAVTYPQTGLVITLPQNLPVGYYQISFNAILGMSGSSTPPTLSFSGNAAAANLYVSKSQSVMGAAAVTTTYVSCMNCFQILPGVQSSTTVTQITASGITYAHTPQSLDVCIQQIPEAYWSAIT